MRERADTQTTPGNGSGVAGMALAVSRLLHLEQAPRARTGLQHQRTGDDGSGSSSCPIKSDSADNLTPDDIVSGVREIQTALIELTARLNESLVAFQGLQTLADGYRRLNDHFYEREVLKPVFLRMLGLADRIRDQKTALDQTRRVLAHAGHTNELSHVCLAEEVMGVVLTDLHALLASYGVEPFETPSPRFNPATQESVPGVLSADESLHGLVAERVAPGYRRGSQLLRPERVRIYVHRSCHAAPQLEE